MVLVAATASAHLLLLSSNKRANSNSMAAKAASEKIEIRVCTNRTCRKQGSLDILQLLSGISPPSVTVNSCGCLSWCGSGPNIVILPETVFVKHCGTPRKAADVMSIVCGVDDDDGVIKCLEALALRNRAEDEMGRAHFSQAYTLLSQVIFLV